MLGGVLFVEDYEICGNTDCRYCTIMFVGYSPSHGLFGCVSDNGNLECFDLRQKAAVGAINAAKASGAVGMLEVSPVLIKRFPRGN